MDPKDSSGLLWMQAITSVHGDYKAGAVNQAASSAAAARGDTAYTCDDIRQAIGQVFAHSPMDEVKGIDQ